MKEHFDEENIDVTTGGEAKGSIVDKQQNVCLPTGKYKK